MITLGFLAIIVEFLNVTVGLLPTGPTLGLTSLMSSFTGGGILGHLGWVNAYIPLDSAMAGVTVILTAWAAFTVFKIVVWVLTKAHILGGSSS